MNTKLVKTFVSVLLVVTAGIAARAQSTYFNAITNLNPAGYWPMHEVAPPAPGDIETNYGSLGVLGNADYPDFEVDNGAFLRQWPGPLANGASKAVYFTNPNKNNGGCTNSLVVPHTSPLTTLQIPFTIEMWFMFTNLPDPAPFQNDIISQCSDARLGGFRVYYQHQNNSIDEAYTGFNMLLYNTNAANQGFQVTVGCFPTNVWHHLVYTVDTNRDVTGYLDGRTRWSTPTRTIPAGRFDPDFYDSLTIGNGLGNKRAINGLISEVAIYTNALSVEQITNHWDIGTNDLAGANDYFDAVTSDNPILYYRMDSAPYTAPDSGTWPVATNYGSAVGNGVYAPGTEPGAVTGTDYNGYPLGLGSANVAPLSGVSSYANVGYADAYNPAGTTPFTVSAIFRGNPTDTNRAQIIVGHGTNSWELGLTQNGYIVFNSGTDSASVVATGTGAGDLVSTTAGYDDGSWHQVVAIHHGTTNVLYVDGLANNTNVVAADNVGNSLDVMIGSDPCYTYNPINWGSSVAKPLGVGAQFAGQICDVAFFTSALTGEEVANLYNQAGVPDVAPVIAQQPPATATVNEGGTITFSAAVLGTLPLSYQWSDWYYSPLMADQTTATLMLSNVPASLNGDGFWLTVTNLYGSTNSEYTVLIVNSGPPQIIASNLPPQVGLAQGQSYTYFVEASGTLPFGYQWSRSGSPVSGATDSSYTVTGTAVGSSTVSVVVTNIYGSASGSSQLTVVAPPTDPYASGILALQPAGYWPLQETYAPAPVTTETNLGTLGSLGNAYYAVSNADGSGTVGGNMVFGQGGALGGTGDVDPSVSFIGPSGVNYAFVPRATPTLTLAPPLSMECWINSYSTAFHDVMGFGGAPGDGSGNWGGMRLSYSGANGRMEVYWYYGNGANYHSLNGTDGTISAGNWYHCVVTYDGTNIVLYVNGAPQNSVDATTSHVMNLNLWTPFTIGDCRWDVRPTRSFNGLVDEVAVYTNVLSPTQVTNHFAAASTYGADYRQMILDEAPLLYYRMNCSGYTQPDPAAFPTAVNFGSAPVNGSYVSGVVPGGVPGPSSDLPGLLNAAPINGVISSVNAGNDPAFNPTDTQPFTALTWFRTYPSDNAVETLMSHGVANWAMNLDGGNGHLVWDLHNAGSITSTNVLNDGQWHMAAGVFDGTTSYLYVDGGLNSSGTVAAGLTGSPDSDLYLGGNADYTNVGSNERYFAGALAQAACFTNALSAVQIQQLYSIGAPQPPVVNLTIQWSGNNLLLSWPQGTLLEAPTVNGPWTTNSSAAPPSCQVSPTDSQMFYRVQVR